VEHAATDPAVWRDVLVLLGAAVATVALFNRLSVGPLLGYFVARFLIGPTALGFVAADSAIRAIAEVGVVFLLFAVGLELPLKRLWVMRRWLFGLGLAQVALTSAGFALVLFVLDHAPAGAIVIGGALALSSTAVGLQVLVDRGELATRHGRAAFAMLLSRISRSYRFSCCCRCSAPAMAASRVPWGWPACRRRSP